MKTLDHIRVILLAALGVLLTPHANASLGGWLYETNREMEAWLGDLEQKTETIGNHQWIYYVKAKNSENNSEPSFETCTLLLHGFTAEGSHWFRFSRHLKNECVIVPDLPAFGRSNYQANKDYSSRAQAKRLKIFLDKLALSKHYNIAGSSMGGHIATIFTLMFPDHVNTLTLFNAGGVESPKLSELDLKVQQTGKSLFEVESLEEFRVMLNTTMSDPPWMPAIVSNHIGQEAIERTARHKKIFKATYKKDFLDQELPNIKVPTLIIWGAEDRLVHPAMANVFHKGIRDSIKIIMPETGHLPFLEKPQESADLFQSFVEQKNIEGNKQ